MDPTNELTDHEFVPFLHSLGVETSNKSFEWMLCDSECSKILRWMYENLDHNNALTPAEECRYEELQKQNLLLTPEELQAEMSSIREQYEHLPEPGDKEAIEDMDMETMMMMERIKFLQNEEQVLQELIVQNESSIETVNCEITRLNAAQNQKKVEEETAASEAVELVTEMEAITKFIVEKVARTLTEAGRRDEDKELCDSMELYRRTQNKFQSYFDLYTMQNFDMKANEWKAIESEVQTAMVEAKNMEYKLSDAIASYIDVKSDLAGREAYQVAMNDFKEVPLVKVDTLIIDCYNTIQLYDQEDIILDDQLRNAILCMVKKHSKLQVDAAIKAVYDVRQGILDDLNYVKNCVERALSIDTNFCELLQRKLERFEEFLQFAKSFKDHVDTEKDAVISRIQSMKSIQSEQSNCRNQLQSNEPIMKILNKILNLPDTDDYTVLVKRIEDLELSTKELSEDIKSSFVDAEKSLQEIKSSQQPLLSYLCDGATRKPNCWDRSVLALSMDLTSKIDKTDAKLAVETRNFTQIKNGDKNNFRKFWQWFLTDPEKMLAAIGETDKKGHQSRTT